MLTYDAVKNRDNMYDSNQDRFFSISKLIPDVAHLTA